MTLKIEQPYKFITITQGDKKVIWDTHTRQAIKVLEDGTVINIELGQSYGGFADIIMAMNNILEMDKI